MSTSSPKERFSAKEAAELSSLSKDMLNYLRRNEILLPSVQDPVSRGMPAYYSYADLVVLRCLADLLKKGVQVVRLKAALRKFQGRNNALKLSKNAKYLLTDGQRIWFRDDENILEELTAGGQLTFNFVISLQTARAEVDRRIQNPKMVPRPHRSRRKNKKAVG